MPRYSFKVGWKQHKEPEYKRFAIFRDRLSAVNYAADLIGKWEAVWFMAEKGERQVQIPDAPWIRQAENDGADAAPDVYCPICNAENPECFYVSDGQVSGCSECTESVDPYEWED